MIKAGVIGWPIEHSKSPIIHRYWIDKYKISGSYEKIALPPDAFESGLRDLIARGYGGVNVTLPHKQTALNCADYITPAAEEIGAANTLQFIDGKIHADNTDGYGFINNLMHTAPDWNAAAGPVLVLGAGGASRAIIYSLLQAGVPEVVITNRTRARAQDMANHFGPKLLVADWQDIATASKMVSAIINTTSLGMIGQPELDFDVTNLRRDCVVNDIVYNPLQTKLLADAQQYGCKTVDGLGMLLHQAVPGFAAWFGTRPNVDFAVREKVLAAL